MKAFMDILSQLIDKSRFKPLQYLWMTKIWRALLTLQDVLETFLVSMMALFKVDKRAPGASLNEWRDLDEREIKRCNV